MSKLKGWIYKNKNDIVDFVLIISAILSIWSYLRLIPILIFGINFLVFKRHLKVSFIFFTIAIGLFIYSLISKPIIDAKMRDFTKKGFHEDLKAESQKTLNILATHIDDYKRINGHLPKSLRDVQRNSMIADVSYVLTEGSFDHAFYYYEILDSNKYYLSGIGKDGIPKTIDDILPNKDNLLRDLQLREQK
jgi:hypothetical protein